MGERVLRGTRLGAISYETDRHTELAPRHEVTFDCPRGHSIVVPFAADAEVPTNWECKQCGALAERRDGERAAEKPVKPPRTHWDMLMERRSVEDLEEVLAERLAILRGNDRKSA